MYTYIYIYKICLARSSPRSPPCGHIPRRSAGGSRADPGLVSTREYDAIVHSIIQYTILYYTYTIINYSIL